MENKKKTTKDHSVKGQQGTLRGVKNLSWIGFVVMGILFGMVGWVGTGFAAGVAPKKELCILFSDFKRDFESLGVFSGALHDQKDHDQKYKDLDFLICFSSKDLTNLEWGRIYLEAQFYQLVSKIKREDRQYVRVFIPRNYGIRKYVEARLPHRILLQIFYLCKSRQIPIRLSIVAVAGVRG
ncbi:MAG: hypothetical protein NZ480_03885 [Bdellovibrionaceae bacterium]|nr:hypothetical protein [Pseudobdellovibrionaceae bacterium]MDW8190904.1 hypothetical protein [Pseudobdellovibrionaceae bacterium]